MSISAFLKKVGQYVVDYFIHLPLILFLDSGDAYQSAVYFTKVYPKEIERFMNYSILYPEFKDQFNGVIEAFRMAGDTVERLLKIHKSSRFGSPTWISSYNALISFVKVPTLSSGPVGFSVSEFDIMVKELEANLDRYSRPCEINGLTKDESRAYHKANVLSVLEKMKKYVQESTLV
jgi:hypothetical protein